MRARSRRRLTDHSCPESGCGEGIGHRVQWPVPVGEDGALPVEGVLGGLPSAEALELSETEVMGSILAHSGAGEPEKQSAGRWPFVNVSNPFTNQIHTTSVSV